MTRKTLTIPHDEGAALALLDGLIVDSPEVITDRVLYPDLPPVVMPATASITVPLRLRALVCPDCGGARLDRHDPLDLDHDDRCSIGAEEAEQRGRDLRRLVKVVRRGRHGFHRAIHPVERDLLGCLDLTPQSHHTGVWHVPGGRRRTFRDLGHEPALATTDPTTEESPR